MLGLQMRRRVRTTDEEMRRRVRTVDEETC